MRKTQQMQVLALEELVKHHPAGKHLSYRNFKQEMSALAEILQTHLSWAFKMDLRLFKTSRERLWLCPRDISKTSSQHFNQSYCHTLIFAFPKAKPSKPSASCIQADATHPSSLSGPHPNICQVATNPSSKASGRLCLAMASSVRLSEGLVTKGGGPQGWWICTLRQ